MSKYGQPMSQTLAHMQMNELKMNDPKLNKIFDKLKKGDTVKLKTSSTMSRGSDFVDYVVKSKNVVNKGRVEKITLATKDNPTSVKKFLYRRDGKVTFAIGDMAASIDDIKEKYSVINHEIIEAIEVEEGYESEVLKVLDDAGIDGYFKNNKLYISKRDARDAKKALDDSDEITKLPKMVMEDVELDEGMKYTHAVVDPDGKVAGMASNEKDAKDIASRHKGKVVKLKKPMSDKKGDMMINRPLEERPIDPADLDLDATDADKKAADKNIIMQMRKAMDVRGNMPIEFADGKKEKVDPKILDMMTKAHMKIQKPRDKEKFVAMISKSKRDMLNVAKKLATLKMGEELELDEKNKLKPNAKFDFRLFDDEDSPGSDKANADMNKEIHKAVRMKDKETARKHMMKVQNKHSKHGATDTEPREVINQILDAIFEMKEKFQSRRPSSKEVKMAIGIANDPRYKGGNYSGAVKAIEKIRDGLSDYPEVAAALKKANENVEEGKMKDLAMKIDSIVAKMKKDKQMKSFADKFKKDAMKSLDIKKSLEKVLPDYIAGKDIQALVKEEVELDEAKYQVNYSKNNKLYSKTINAKDEDDAEEKAIKKFKIDDDDIRSVVKESLDEKYDLYHKTFSDAMQHAYDYAKKKLGITVDPKEIDNKVATGPKKPSEGKTNKYRLKGKGGNLQIQVYNKGGSKPFELNMYKEENDMTKSLKDTILEMRKEGFASDAQRKAAFASGYKEKDKKKKDEEVKTEKKLDKVNPTAVKKKFDDRKDKDIDNDGDVDSTDKYLHKRRKAISKAVKSEEVDFKRYHETKQGSLRDTVLQMWGEVNEKVSYVVYKFKNDRDAKAAKKYFDGIQLMSFDVNDDRSGYLYVDAGSEDMTKYHKEVMKKFKPMVRAEEKKDLTKEKKDDTKKMTDTGKEVTPVETSVKMPKIKETKNKV